MNYLPQERNYNSPVLLANFNMCQIVFALEKFFFVSNLLFFFLSLCRVIKFNILLGEKTLAVFRSLTEIVHMHKRGDGVEEIS